MREMQLPPLQLHHQSLAFFGGGWKTHADREILNPRFMRG
jgi:hypothetical protein